MGINTVLDLASTPSKSLRQMFSIVMERTVLELQGVSCMELAEVPVSKQQIVASRSFVEKITELSDLKEAMAKYVQDTFHRLRSDGSLCGCLVAFVQSSPFDSNAPYYSKSTAY